MALRAQKVFGAFEKRAPGAALFMLNLYIIFVTAEGWRAKDEFKAVSNFIQNTTIS